MKDDSPVTVGVEAVKRVEMRGPAEKAFHNWKAGAFHLSFPNGNWLSTTFAPGSYSENYDATFHLRNVFVAHQSGTCEIAFECDEKLRRKIYRKFAPDSDNSVIGHLDILQWSAIVALLATQPSSRRTTER